MRIAIVGAGVSGLVVASRLHPQHEITLFEKDRRLGGHAHTVTVDDAGVERRLDTGFLVFNRRDYPRFSAILDRLGVASRPTCMSFSVRCSRSGVEYSGSGVRGLFSQPVNALRPAFLRMLLDLVRFYREGRHMVARLPEDATIDDLVRAAHLSEAFIEWHLLPLGSALWSAPRHAFRRYPARFVVDFLARHDLLETRLGRRVQWQTVVGGSSRYVQALAEPFSNRVHLGTAVRSVRRVAEGVRLRTTGGEAVYDQVVLACHGDDVLALLEDATPEERRILEAVRYQANDVILHTDRSLLPRRRGAQASWNYHIRTDRDPATLTYDINRLQGFRSDTRFCVTLNDREAIDPARIIRRFSYRHPQYSVEWVRLRRERAAIQGGDRVWFCGAYIGNGFHEDAVRSAEEAVEGILRSPAPAGAMAS